MKTVENEKIVVKLHHQEPYHRQPYRCKLCGEVDNGRVCYEETCYGRATINDLDGDYSDYDVDDYDNWRPLSYYCCNCNESRDNIHDLFEYVEEERTERRDDLADDDSTFESTFGRG